VLEIPALEELRKVVGERLRQEQLNDTVRADIDPYAVGSGLISMFLSLLMSVTQIGRDAISTYAPGIIAVTEAALVPPQVATTPKKRTATRRK
jgi:hypothetical protein